MTKQKSTKRALLMSGLALLMCVSMLIGSTFAWFTDSVTSAGNKIQAGTLKIDLELLEENGSWTSIKDSNKAIFNYDKWEPGYTDVKVLRVTNEGTLALKWIAKFVSANDLTDLAKVIDVYVNDTVTAYPEKRTDLTGWKNVGTVADFVNTISTTTYGNLEAKESAYLGIALRMQETAGNEYQGMDLGGAFDIQILATQYTSEKDSFDEKYDSAADYPNVSNTIALDTTSTDGVKLTSTGENAVTANVSATLVQSLANAGIEKITLCHSEPKFDATTGVVTFDSVELVDQDGKIIDLADFDGTLTITLPVDGIADGTVVTVYHDGVVITDNVSVHDGTISYTTEHLCKIEIKKSELKMPTATVTELGAQTVYTDNGNVQFPLEYVLQFSTTDTAETIENSPYKYWNADFVVSFDKNVAMGSAALVGYYPEWDENYWYGMNIPEEGLKAGEGFRVLSELFEQFPTFGNSDCVSYEYVVNMVKDFKCGVADFEKYLDANGVSEEDRNGGTYGLEDGTVITVELRLYETTPVEIEKPDGSGGTIIQYQETGDSYVIATYVYTYTE